ncbi:hypothetical protein D7W82_27780 [Corallococcus sp. CA049B]|nr:hypothetical protein D7W82_27780 [Corallococcus sp. CA049B]
MTSSGRSTGVSALMRGLPLLVGSRCDRCWGRLRVVFSRATATPWPWHTMGRSITRSSQRTRSGRRASRSLSYSPSRVAWSTALRRWMWSRASSRSSLPREWDALAVISATRPLGKRDVKTGMSSKPSAWSEDSTSGREQ